MAISILLTNIYMVWVAIGKVLPEFVYFAVEIYHRATLPSATLNFPAGKNFANRPKHQTRRRAWVGQADFKTWTGVEWSGFVKHGLDL